MEVFYFRYNISFIDPMLGEFGEIYPSAMIFPEGNIITSGNISPNPSRSVSVNEIIIFGSVFFDIPWVVYRLFTLNK